MPDTDSITLVKEMQYRGQPEEWSNTYHLDGTTPTSAAEWETLARAIWASEKTVMNTASKLVTAYGYVAGNDHSVAQIDFRSGSQTGLIGQLDGGSSGRSTSGDQACWVRAKVGTSVKGKAVYVRKYYHSFFVDGGTPDTVLAGAQAALVAHATLMLAGSLPGGMKWVGPQGATPIQPKASQFATTRTLKRRGKRP